MSAGAWGDCSPYSREIDELYSRGSLPLWLHMKAGWFSSKPSLTFSSRGCCRCRDIATLPAAGAAFAPRFLWLKFISRTLNVLSLLGFFCIILLVKTSLRWKLHRHVKRHNPGTSVMCVCVFFCVFFFWLCLCSHLPRAGREEALGLYGCGECKQAASFAWAQVVLRSLRSSHSAQVFRGGKPQSSTEILNRHRRLAGHYHLGIICAVNNAFTPLPSSLRWEVQRFP